jgi:hypothetical protein
MMIRKIFLFNALIFLSACLNAQVAGGIFPEMLQKELVKYAGKDIVVNEYAFPAEMSMPVYSGKFYAISAITGTQITGYIYMGKVNTCRAGGCSIQEEHPSDSASEFLEYFILFDSHGTIKLVRIFNYMATYGQEITSKGWLKQFVNYKGNEVLIAGKNIDAISGATTSVDAITFDIQDKAALLRKAIHAR